MWMCLLVGVTQSVWPVGLEVHATIQGSIRGHSLLPYATFSVTSCLESLRTLPEPRLSSV